MNKRGRSQECRSMSPAPKKAVDNFCIPPKNQDAPPPTAKFLQTIISQIHQFTGLDSSITFTVLARFWSMGAGIITLTLITRFLSPEEQGFYYTFYSLVALQIVFELGFSFVILQLAAHERAKLNITPSGQITGSRAAHARLASILQKSVRWYSIAAALMAVILLPSGSYFFGNHSSTGSTVSWHTPWIMVVLATSLTFQLDPIFSFFEGCGFVSQVARLRVGQAVLGSSLAWIALFSKHGLYSPSLTILGQAIAGICFLFNKRKLLLALLRYRIDDYSISWRKEILPFQWRIAISWFCGYFIFQLYNPILFAYRGPTAAGQMGMSLNLANAIQSVAVAWISTKNAPFGSMVARKEYKLLDQVFFRTLKQAIWVFLIGGLAVWVGDFCLSVSHPNLGHRLLDPLPLGLMFIASAINIIITAQAAYIRAHKQEKFLLNSVVGAILVSTSAYFLGRYYGAIGMVIGNLIITSTFGLGLGTHTFMKYRRLWHADGDTIADHSNPHV